MLFATQGKCDKFIYNGDTININSKSLLDKYSGIKSLKAKLPACYRVEWALVNNELLLNNIYACATTTSHLKALNLKSLFKTNDARIVANWVTDTLWFPVGRQKKIWGTYQRYSQFGITDYSKKWKRHLKNGIYLS